MTSALALVIVHLCGAAPLLESWSGRQNPREAQVVLPDGWRMGGDHNVSSGTLVKGPKGEEIFYPAYVSTGVVAYAQISMDYQVRFVRAVIGGRRVDVAITRKNFLAVSYADIDYWTDVKDTSQAVQSLLILLTHVDVSKSEGEDRAGGFRQMPPQREDYPFSSLNVGNGAFYEHQTESFYSRYKPASSKTRIRISSQPWPANVSWKHETKLMGGWLKVAKEATGLGYAKYTDKDGKPVTYSWTSDDPADALLAILASVTRVRK